MFFISLQQKRLKITLTVILVSAVNPDFSRSLNQRWWSSTATCWLLASLQQTTGCRWFAETLQSFGLTLVTDFQLNTLIISQYFYALRWILCKLGLFCIQFSVSGCWTECIVMPAVLLCVWECDENLEPDEHSGEEATCLQAISAVRWVWQAGDQQAATRQADLERFSLSYQERL